jgi:hypothetical protein
MCHKPFAGDAAPTLIGETLAIPASRRLSFSPAKAVRDALNATASEAKARAG